MITNMLDIDECAGSEALDICGQMCINALGTFSCECKTYYTLKDDGITCEGKEH